MKSILKNKSLPIFNSIGIVSYSLCQWVIIKIISNNYPTATLGDYALSLSYLAPLTLFFCFSLRNFFNSHNEEVNVSDIFTHRIVSTIIYFLCSLLILKLFVPNVDNSVFILLMLIRGGDLLSDLAYTVKQRQKDIRYIGVSLSLKSLFIIIICLVANIQADIAIDHFLIGILLITTIFFVIDLKTSIPSFSFKTDYIKRITILTTPLALASLVNSVNANIPRYLLDFYYDKTSVAIFSTFFFFYSSIIIITNSFIQVSLNKLSLSLNSLVETRKMIKSYIIFAFMTSSSFILFNELIGQFIYNLIFGTKYTEYAHYLHYLNIIIPQAIAIIMINYFVIALRSYKTSFLFTSLTLIVHFAVAMVLIKGSEIEGSFDAFIIAQAFYIIINIVFITKKVRELRHEF